MGDRGAWPLVLSMIVELAGIAAITVGCAQIASWLGLIVGGIGLLVVGAAIDPPQRRQGRVERGGAAA